MAHTAQYQKYIRCEGNTLLRKLPEEARLSLRYYETVGSLRPFRPLPPLASSRKVIAGKQYYYVAVTDWSLYLLSKDNKVEGSVLLEIPWLGVRELDKAEADSDDFMKQDPNTPDSVVRSAAISIFPRVDIGAITPAILRKAGLSDGHRRRSSHNKPSSPRLMQPSAAVAAIGCPGSGVGGGDKKHASGRGGGGGGDSRSDGHGISRGGADGTETSRCCGWGSNASATAVAAVPTSPGPMQSPSQHLPEQSPQPLSSQAKQAILQAVESRFIQLQPSDATDQRYSMVPERHTQLGSDQATKPLRADFVAERIPMEIYPSPQPWQYPGHRTVQHAVRFSPGLYYRANASHPAHLSAAVGQPAAFCPQLHQMWGQWHQHQQLRGALPYGAGAVQSYVAAPCVATYTDPYTGELYDEDWAITDAAGGPPCWIRTANGAGQTVTHGSGPGPHMAYTLVRMMPGTPLGEATYRPSSDPAALHLSTTAAAVAGEPPPAAAIAAALPPQAPQLPGGRGESLFGTLRRRGEGGATTQARSAIAFTRTMPVVRPRRHDERGGGSKSLSSSLRGPEKDAELHQAVETGMRQLEESLRRQPRPQLVLQVSPPRSQTSIGNADGDGAGGGAGYGPSASPPSASPPTGPVAHNRLSISLRPYLTGAAVASATARGPVAAALLRRSSVTHTEGCDQPQEDLSEAAAMLQPQVLHQVRHQAPLQPAPAAWATAAIATGQHAPSAGSATAATAAPRRRETSKVTYRSTASVVDGHVDGSFPPVTRKGRRSRNLPPEDGSFQLPLYPSCQPVMVPGQSLGGAASSVAGGVGAVSLPTAVTVPLVRLGEQVLWRQLRARPRAVWEEHERQGEARWAAEKRRNGAGGVASGGGSIDGEDGGDGGGLPHDDEYEAAEEYEDFWIPDRDDDELSPEGRALSEYRLILVTIERKSNLFFHIQKAWIGAHMRLALTEAAVRGMPLWYAPAFLPRRLVVDMPALTDGNNSGGAAHETVGPETLELPEVRGALDATKLALEYFSETGILSRVLDSAAGSAGAAGALELFPGDSPLLYGMQPSGSFLDMDSGAPVPTLEDLSVRMSSISPSPSAAASRKSLMQLGSLLAAAGRGSGGGPTPMAGATVGQARSSRQTSRVSDGDGGDGGGGTSAGGGGNSNELALSVSISSAFLSLYDAQRSRRKGRLANVLGAQGRQSLALPQPADARQRAGLMALPHNMTADLANKDNKMGAVRNGTGSLNATSRQVQQQDGSGGGGGESRRTSRRLISWHPAIAGEGTEESSSPPPPPPSRLPWQSQPQTRQQSQPTSQPEQQHSLGTEAHAAASIAAAANLAAERYGADVDAREARSFYGEVQEAMRWGCSLFDEGDANLIQEIILERAFSQTPGARKLSKCFFNSRVVMSFILSRLYAWGAVCAMFSSSTATRAPTQTQVDNVVQDSALAYRSDIDRSLRRSMGVALPKEVRRSDDGGIDDGGQTAAAAGPWLRLKRCPSPWAISDSSGGVSGGARGSRIPRSPKTAGGHRGGTNGGNGAGAQSASYTIGVTSRPSSVPSSVSYVASDVPSVEVPSLVPSSEPAAFREAPFEPRPKKSALDQAVDLEEERAFFQRLHNNRTWAVFSRGVQRHRHLLRRLGLNPTEPTSIRATVETLAEIVQLQQQRAGQGPVGQRSPAPDTQAPPTLSPDPLSLSPLNEAPFLFVLQHQQLHGNGYSGSDGGDGAASEVLDIMTGRTARAEAQVRGSLFGDIMADGGGSGGRGSSMMSGMRAAYLRSIMQIKTEPTEELLDGPAVELWERLVGRLAARLAHKRVKRLLFWVQQELAFSEGCEDRVSWLSDVLVESDPNAPPELDWSFARCSRTLVALVMQLVNPNPPEPVGGRYPPEVQPIKPRNPTDMLYWIQYEIKSYSLDWSVGILYEMTGLSEEAQAVGRYEQEDIVLQVVRQLPTELLHQFVRRMFLRLACFVLGYAELYGVARQQSLAVLVMAFRYGSVLLALVRSIQSCADVLADEFFHELYYLFRTQQVQDRLQEVCGGKDTLLAESTRHMFEGVLQCIGDAAMLHAPGGAAGAQSVGHITNRAVFPKIPGRLT